MDIIMDEESVSGISDKLSDCCQASVIIGGDDGEGTHYYICTDCDEPCDIYHEETDDTEDEEDGAV